LTDNFSWTGEADIPYYRRVAIHDGLSGYIDIPEDNFLPYIHIDDIDVDVDYDSVVEPRISINDIEVHVPEDGSFEEMQENADEPIIAICCYDTYEEEYTVFYYDKYGIEDSEKQEIRPKIAEQLEGTGLEEYGEANITLVSSDSEVEMLRKYISYIDGNNFDLVSGWNYTDFDRDYIRRRIKALSNSNNIHHSWLSPFRTASYSHDEHRKLPGRPPFDMMRAFTDKLTFSNWRSKSLEYVANEELGIGKVEDVDINEDWKNNPSRLIGYNIVDVLLTVSLDDINDIHNFFYEMADVASVPIYDIFYEKRIVDGYVLKYRGDDEILPTSDESELVENAGGYVADPIQGRKQNIGVSDLKSLYPSVIITWNLSTETVSETPEDFEEYVKIPKVPEPKSVSGDITEDMMDWEWLYASLDEEGLIPRVSKKLFRKRNHEKEQMYGSPNGSQEEKKWERKQGATKIIMNSIYGNLSSKYYRLSNEYLGDSVTSTARYTLWKGEQTIGRLGYEHIYSDSITDDRNVIVKDPKNNIVLRTMEDLWSESENKTESEKERAELRGWQCLSVNERGESEWKNIESIIRHKTNKEIIRFEHAQGITKTTKDHSFAIPNGEEIVEKKPSEVERPYRAKVPNETNTDSVELIEHLDRYERESIDERGGVKKERKKKVRTSLFGDLFYGHAEEAAYKRAVFCKNGISNENLESLCRLCGAYVSDGSASTDKTTDSRWGASIANDNTEWLEKLKKDYQRLFDGATSSIIASDSSESRTVQGYNYNDKTKKLQMMNRLSAVIFASLCGQKSSGKKVPDFIFNLDDHHKEIFLDSAIKGDGSRKFQRYTEEYSESNFTYTTISEKLASGISTLCSQLGYKYNINYREEKGSYEIRTANRYEGRDQEPRIQSVDVDDAYVYDLSVEDNDNFVDAMGQVLLHNTDSHFIQLTRDTLEGQVEELQEISAEMDADASEIAQEIGIDGEHPYLIDEDLHGDEYTCLLWEPEKIYSTFMQLGNKKRYTGNIRWKEGTVYNDTKISISGFENQRSDSMMITADLQENIIEMILTNEDFVTVSEYLRSIIEQIDSKHKDVHKFALPGSINKDLEDYPNRQIPRGCLWSNEHLDKEFGEGDDPFVYLVEETPSGLPQTDVVALEWNEEVPDGFVLDKEAIIERGIRKPIQPIIEEMNWQFNELRTGKRQKKRDLSTGGSNPFA